MSIFSDEGVRPGVDTRDSATHPSTHDESGRVRVHVDRDRLLDLHERGPAGVEVDLELQRRGILDDHERAAGNGHRAGIDAPIDYVAVEGRCECGVRNRDVGRLGNRAGRLERGRRGAAPCLRRCRAGFRFV